MAPTNKVRARVRQGKGELLAIQLAANRIFRQNETSETASLPRHVVTIDDVTAGLPLDAADVQIVQRVILDTNAHFDQKTQTHRLTLARQRLVLVLRSMKHIDSDTRMELTKRAIAYWRRTTQTDYGKPPTVRAMAFKSEPTLVVKAVKKLNGSEKRITMPQIPAAKLQEFLHTIEGAAARKKLDPKKLQPTQDKLDTAKVERLKNTPEALKKPIVVSHDGWIIDGHHRWAAHKALGTKVPCVVVTLDKNELLEQARDFDGAEFRKAGPPGQGWQAIPKGKKGGYRKRVGGKWHYWYPEATPRRGKTEDADLWSDLSHAQIKRWRRDFRKLTKAMKQLNQMAGDELGTRGHGNVPAPSAAFQAEFHRLERAFAVFNANLKRWGDKHVAGTARSMDAMKRIIAKFEAIPRAEVLFGYGFHDEPDVPNDEPLPSLFHHAYEGSYASQEFKRYQRKVSAALKEADRYIANEGLSNFRRRPVETFVRGKVQYHIYAGGFLPGEKDRIRTILRHVDTTERKLREKGLGATLEGLTLHVHGEYRIEAEGREASDRPGSFVTAGYYNTREDEVRLFQTGFSEHTLTHELGHRVYFQQMSPEGRAAWERFYQDRRKTINLRDIETLVDILSRHAIPDEDAKRLNLQRGMIDLAAAQHEINQIQGTRAPQLKALVEQAAVAMTYHPRKASQFTAEDWMIAYRNAYLDAERPPATANKLVFTVVEEFVSQYAETNASELFAEAFDQYVREGRRKLAPEIRDQLERALRSTGMKLKKAEDNEPTLVVKARPMQNPNVQTHNSRGAPRFDYPPMPDFQGVYYPPEDKQSVRREREQFETRRQAEQKRNQGKFGIHGEVPSRKVKTRWKMERTMSADAFANPASGQKREPRKSPKMSARTREEEGQLRYEGAQVESEGKDKTKRKRKKKKKRVRLTARKTT